MMRALILVDLQNDFLPGGALAVAHGDEVIAVANTLAPRFPCVIATQDWHPVNHCSFSVNQPVETPESGWPVHCVQRSHGAEFSSALNVHEIRHVVRKGQDPQIDSYSGFFDNDHRSATDLDDYLKRNGVTEVYAMGLATDYCVKATALDAVRLGYLTFVIIDGCRGVDWPAGSVARSLEELRQAGVGLIESKHVPSS